MVQDRNRALVLDRWSGRASATASRGGYRVGHGRVTLRFSGTRVVYVAVTGPALGLAEMAVDHGPAKRVSLYSPAAGRRSWTIRAAPGRHVLSVHSTGDHVTTSTGTAITIDEFVVGASRDAVHVDDRSLRVSFGHWAGSRLPSASGGSVRRADGRGASVRIAFTGTSLTWVTATGPNQGRARVQIDGTTVETVDNHAATPTARLERSYSGLSPGAHTATIVVLGGGSGSAASRVTIDAFKLDVSNQARLRMMR